MMSLPTREASGSPVIRSPTRRIANILVRRLSLALVVAIAGLLTLPAVALANFYGRAYVYSDTLGQSNLHGGQLKMWTGALALGCYECDVVDDDFWIGSHDQANWVEAGIVVGDVCTDQPAGSGCTKYGIYRVPRFFWGDQRPGDGYHEHIDVSDEANVDTYYEDTIHNTSNGTWHASIGPWAGDSTSNEMYAQWMGTGTEDSTQNEAYACNGQSELAYWDQNGNFQDGWAGAQTYADNPPHADFVGTPVHVHDWAGYTESQCFGSTSALARPLSGRRERATPAIASGGIGESEIKSIALGFSTAYGDTNPTSIEHVEASRAAAELVSANDVVQDNRDVYLIVVQGNFTAEGAPRAPGAPPPTGSVLMLTVDAQTGQLTDLGIQNNVPDLSSLGPVTVDK